jgi:SAM-dependent methyltransferase
MMSKDELHRLQQRFWNAEHARPTMVLNMDYHEPSRGVVRFTEWLEGKSGTLNGLQAIEMGCGKGRNAIWLSQRGMNVHAFDFSDVAIDEAKRRAHAANHRVDFCVHDATTPWPWIDGTFDVAIDCFASTDIETFKGRSFARDELLRVLKPNGFLFVHAISSRSTFHRMMLETRSASERNTYTHPGSKIDKVYDAEELRAFYDGCTTLAFATTSGEGVFYGKKYLCENFWMVLTPHDVKSA